jgi:hypothetical protein
MPASSFRSLGLVVVTFAIGCSDTVCFQWGADEGACPPREEAKNYVADDCTEPILSWESDGELEDGACCYEVEKGDSGACY